LIGACTWYLHKTALRRKNFANRKHLSSVEVLDKPIIVEEKQESKDLETVGHESINHELLPDTKDVLEDYLRVGSTNEDVSRSIRKSEIEVGYRMPLVNRLSTFMNPRKTQPGKKELQ
jgi:hypothetical protein